MMTKTAAADAAARGIGDGMPIPDIGSVAWQQMLIYAREFAVEAFPDHDEPKLVTGETCVLCQQPLDGAASARMAEFDRYILGRAASDSHKAVAAYDALVVSINALRIKTPAQAEALLGVYGGMSDERQAFTAEIVTAYGVLIERLGAIKAMIKKNSFGGADELVSVQADLIEKIDADIEALKGQINGLEDVRADTARFEELNATKSELEDYKRLSQEIEIVVERLKQLAERLKIKDARKQCASGPIARQLTARRRAVLTESLKNKLTQELETLRLSHIPIDLSDRSAGGDSVIEVGLTAQQRFANNSDVLSEGEQRALALSCFLAELTEVGAEHGIWTCRGLMPLL